MTQDLNNLTSTNFGTAFSHPIHFSFMVGFWFTPVHGVKYTFHCITTVRSTVSLNIFFGFSPLICPSHKIGGICTTHKYLYAELMGSYHKGEEGDLGVEKYEL